MTQQLIDNASGIGGPSQFDLFKIPGTQIAVDRTYPVDFHPLNPIEIDPIRFQMPPNTTFADVGRHLLLTRFRVVHQDGTLINTNAVGPPLQAAGPAPDFPGLIQVCSVLL